MCVYVSRGLIYIYIYIYMCVCVSICFEGIDICVYVSRGLIYMSSALIAGNRRARSPRIESRGEAREILVLVPLIVVALVIR